MANTTNNNRPGIDARSQGLPERMTSEDMSAHYIAQWERGVGFRQRIKDYEHSLGDIYYWQPAQKARLISISACLLHALVTVCLLAVYFLKPQNMSIGPDTLLMPLQLSMLNVLLMGISAGLSHAFLKHDSSQNVWLFLSLFLFVLSMGLLNSFLGFFDGLTWLIFFLFNSALFIFLDRKIVVITFSCLLLVMIMMTIYAEQMPFQVRVLRHAPELSFAQIETKDLWLQWFFLLFAGAIGVILLDFLLSAWRIRDADLRSKSYVDDLTGLMNRRAVIEGLGDEFKRAKRIEYPLAVAMLDLDHFKKVNDRYGHQFGDQVLREVSGVLTDICRRKDLVGRYGGEEFLIVFPECNVTDANKILERVRETIKTMEIKYQGVDGVFITVSSGLTEMQVDDIHYSELIGRADFALYEAKKAGRDRTMSVSYLIEDAITVL